MDRKLPNPALSPTKLCKAGKLSEKVRLDLNMTMEEFCKKLGTSTSSYYDKRKGTTKFTEKEKKKIKKLGNLSYEEFYKGFFK